MIRKTPSFFFVLALVSAVFAPRAIAAAEILFCRGPLPHSLDVNGILTIHNKPASAAAGPSGSALPPGTCAFADRGLSVPAPLALKGPATNLANANDLIRQQGMFTRVVTAITAHLGDTTAVFGFFVETNASGKPTRVLPPGGTALNYAVSVGFSAVPPATRFDPSSFRFDVPSLVIEKR